MATTIDFPPVVGRVAIGLVLLAALTAPWTGVKLATGGAPADVLVVLALGVVFLMVAFSDLRFSVPGWPLLPCLALLVCVLVRQVDPPPGYVRVLRMQLWGYYPDDLTKAVFWMFALLLVPTAVVACTAIDRRAAVWVMGAFVSGATVSCAIAVTDLLGVTPDIGQRVGEGTQICTFKCFNAGLGGRMNGLTDHPNTLGMTAVISIPLAVYFANTMRRKWLGAAALIILFGGVLASGSRGAQAVAPLCALAAVFWLPTDQSGRRTRTIGVLGAILSGVAVLAVMPAHLRDGLFRIFDVSRNAGSNSERFRLIRAAIADWHAHPVFGSGIRHLVEAHNIYLQFLASGGIVLAMAMLVYFIVVLYSGWKLSREGNLFARFLTLSIGTWLVLGLVENAISDRYLYYSIGCLAALATTNLRSPPVASQRLDSGAVPRTVAS